MAEFWKFNRQSPAEKAQEARTRELVSLAYNSPAAALHSLGQSVVTTEGNGVFLRPWHKQEVVLAAVDSYMRKKHYSTALRTLAGYRDHINKRAQRGVLKRVQKCIESFSGAGLANGMIAAVDDLEDFIGEYDRAQMRIHIQTRARQMRALTGGSAAKNRKKR